MDLFPALPESLAELSDEQLAEALSAALAAKDKIVAQDPEFLGDLGASEILDQMKAGVSSILALKAEQASRLEAQENLASELAALSAQVDPEEPAPDDPDEEPGEDEPLETPASEEAAEEPEASEEEPAEVPEAVVAAAPKPVRRMPAQGRHAAPPAAGGNGPAPIALRASAGLTRYGPGHVFTGEQLNEAMMDQINTKTTMPPGIAHKVVLASADITTVIPEHRRLREHGESESDRQKIETLVAAAKRSGVGAPLTASGEPNWAEAEALTASGGICAPLTPYYQLAYISTMARPVRDSLVSFIADRGGVRYAPPPYLGQITDGVGIITAEQDAAGGSSGTKTCQELICPEFTDAAVDSVFHCFTGGNLGARAFPEQASQFSSLILTQHARVAETNLLNKIKAGSTQVTGQSSVLGAISSLLNDILTAAAAYRSNNRMADDSPLQVILPAWTSDLLLIDLIQSQFQRFQLSKLGLEALFGTYNLRVTYTLDGPSDGNGQILARQAGGALNPLPTEVEWALFAPGSWLFVDSGVLELGIVRDSVLNATNSYQVFGESWETAAGIGVQSLWVTSTVCPSGTVALPTDNTSQCD